MSYKTTTSQCFVRLVPLDLNHTQEQRCEEVRREAGRCWTDMVTAHVESRGGPWLTEGDLKQESKGRYALHSQSVQALAEKLIANVDTARTLRAQGNVDMEYPYREKAYQTVTWKRQAIRRQGNTVVLSTGRQRKPLELPLPQEYQNATIRQIELLWRADHYELALTIDRGLPLTPIKQDGLTAGVDLGEVNIAAMVAENGQGAVVSGRGLRSVHRLRNKRHAAYTTRLDRSTPGSRRHRRLLKRKAQASARFARQVRDILHKASRQLVDFAQQHGVNRLAVGDVRDIADGAACGRHQNQRLSQWAHGQFVGYVTYKARAVGITTAYIPEDYSTRTCSMCGYCCSSSPRGRVFRCPGCGAVLSRDGNGGANICSRARYGSYGQVQVEHLTYLRPLVVAPRRGPKLLAQTPVLEPHRL